MQHITSKCNKDETATNTTLSIPGKTIAMARETRKEKGKRWREEEKRREKRKGGGRGERRREKRKMK